MADKKKTLQEEIERPRKRIRAGAGASGSGQEEGRSHLQRLKKARKELKRTRRKEVGTGCRIKLPFVESLFRTGSTRRGPEPKM